MLVSRDSDLRKLDNIWESKGKKGALLLLMGPDGSGKSTLIRNFAEMKKLNLIYYRCEEEDRYIPLGIIRKVSMMYFPGIFNSKAGVNTIFNRFEEALSKFAPGILLISNSQHADNLTLKFVEYFSVHPVPGILIVVSFPTTSERRELDNLIEKLAMTSSADVFVLGNIDADEVMQYIQGTHLPLEIERVYKITGGNMESLDLLINCWKVKNKLVRSKKDGYLCLYSSLTDKEREILKYGSVIGNFIPTTLLESVIDDLNDGDLSSLVDKGILIEFRSVYNFGGRDGYLFRNSRFREFVYSRIEDKASAHLRVARAIEKMKLYTNWERKYELAKHYIIAKNATKAIPYLEDCANYSLELKDYSSATYYMKHIENLLNVSNDNSLRVWTYTNLIVSLARIGNGDKSLRYANKLHSFSELERAWVHRNMGDLKYAIKESREVRKCGDMYLNMVSYGIEADCYARLGFYKKAMKLQKKNIRVAEKLGNLWELAVGYKNLGNVYMGMLQYDYAEEYYRKAMKLFKKLKDKRGIFAVYNNIGIIYNDNGKHNRALNYFKKSLELAESMGDYDGLATVYNNLGAVYEYLGDFYNAVESYRKSVDYSFLSGNVDGMNYAYGNLGSILMHAGNFRDAYKYLKKQMDIAEKMESIKFMISARIRFANFYYLLRYYDMALKYAKEAIALGKKYGDIYDMLDAHYYIAKVHYAMGDEESCVSLARQALELYKEAGIEDEASHIYGLLARCTGQDGLGEMERVVRIKFSDDQYEIWMAKVIVLAKEGKEHWAYLEGVIEGLKKHRNLSTLVDFLEEYYRVTGYEQIREDIEKIKRDFTYPNGEIT